MSPTRPMLVLFLLLAFPILPACGIERKGGASAGRGPISHASDAESPFAPAQLVIHPLSRVVKDPATGEERVELHLELRDRWEDSVKWLGDAVIELFKETPPVANASVGNEQVKRWTINLTNPDENVKAYDRVTRTYRLTLVGLPADQRKNAAWKLEARWLLPSGRTLTASQRMD
ncbi:MAG: hypothetical protein ACKVZJ_08995 [Phycisphaerales bacterium]